MDFGQRQYWRPTNLHESLNKLPDGRPIPVWIVHNRRTGFVQSGTGDGRPVRATSGSKVYARFPADAILNLFKDKKKLGAHLTTIFHAYVNTYIVNVLGGAANVTFYRYTGRVYGARSPRIITKPTNVYRAFMFTYAGHNASTKTAGRFRLGYLHYSSYVFPLFFSLPDDKRSSIPPGYVVVTKVFRIYVYV